MPQYDMLTPTPAMPDPYRPTPMPVPMDNSITNWNPAYTPAKKPTIADMLMRANLGSAATAPQSQNLTLSNVPQDLTLSNVPQTLTLGNVPQQGMALGSLMNKYY